MQMVRLIPLIQLGHIGTKWVEWEVYWGLGGTSFSIDWEWYWRASGIILSVLELFSNIIPEPACSLPLEMPSGNNSAVWSQSNMATSIMAATIVRISCMLDVDIPTFFSSFVAASHCWWIKVSKFEQQKLAVLLISNLFDTRSFMIGCTRLKLKSLEIFIVSLYCSC